MRVKVELHREVVRFIRHHCSDDEVDAFYERLESIRTEPIEHSEPVADPRLSRYMLRFFRFGRNMAIFQYRPATGRPPTGRIIVRQCRRLRAKPRPSDERDEQAGRP